MRQYIQILVAMADVTDQLRVLKQVNARCGIKDYPVVVNGGCGAVQEDGVAVRKVDMVAGFESLLFH